jgi:ADP-ribose pyrophosphatase YjhB (NUDIX family)
MDKVDVAVVVITRGQRLLTVFNSSWGSFTLPMTKLRIWDDPSVPSSRREETWIQAAARAAAENMGRTISFDELEFMADLPEFRQGDRDGIWKRYHFQVFRLTLSESAELKTRGIVEWLTVEELLDSKRAPISPTACALVPKTQQAAADSGKQFL